MDDTLNKKINFYSKDNNNKTGINKEYISSDKYIKKDIEKKICVRYNTPINKYKDNKNIYFTPNKKRKFFSYKTEKILKDINEVKGSLNKLHLNLSYYNIPNQFKHKNFQLEKKKNYSDNNYIKLKEIQNLFNQKFKYKPNNYSYSTNKYYKVEKHMNYLKPSKFKISKNHSNKNNIRFKYQKSINNIDNNLNNSDLNDLRNIDNEFVNYMNIMNGLKKKRLNQWRIEFKEDNLKY